MNDDSHDEGVMVPNANNPILGHGGDPPPGLVVGEMKMRVSSLCVLI